MGGVVEKLTLNIISLGVRTTFGKWLLQIESKASQREKRTFAYCIKCYSLSFTEVAIRVLQLFKDYNLQQQTCMLC